LNQPDCAYTPGIV